MAEYSKIREATEALKSVCDGATSEDGAGFNMYDAGFARKLLAVTNWTPRQAIAIHKMLKKYRFQLGCMGIDYDKLPVPTESVSPGNGEKVSPDIKRAYLKDDRISLNFKIANTQDFYLFLNEHIKCVQGRQFHKEDKRWSFPLTVHNIKYAKQIGFKLDPKLREWLKKKEEADKEAEQRAQEELKKVTKLTPYPFQAEGVQMLEKFNGRALLADEMGLGKTIQAILYMKLHKELRPSVVVVPASVKINWQREFDKWLPGEKTKIVMGRSDTIKGSDNIIIINYDILSDYTDLLDAMDPKLLVLDESHMIKNPKALRTKSVKILAKGIDKVICISGTPITNRPIEFFTTLNLLDPEQFNNYYRFGNQFCGAKHNGFAWEYKGSTNPEKLHQILVDSFMIRRLKKDVLTELPPKTRSVLPMEINNRSEYNKARDDLINYLRQTEGSEAAQKATMAETLVKFNKLKQLSIQGKLKQCIDWIENFIDQEKLVVFCVHHKTIDALMEHFGDKAVRIDGRVSQGKRQKAIDSFQNDDNIRLFVGNIKAAGVGITLTKACNAAFLELEWVPALHDQAEDRIHRISQERDHVNIYYLVGLDTIEEDLTEVIDSKRKVITEIMDGELPEEEAMLTILIEKYKEQNGYH